MAIEPVEPRPKRTGRQAVDLILALSALFVSAVSIYIAYQTSVATERQAEANVQMVQAASWPFLQLSSTNSRNDEPVLAFAVNNAGVGPARVHTFEFLVDGQSMPPVNMFTTMAQACCAEEYAQVTAGVASDPYAALGTVGTYSYAPGLIASGDNGNAMVWRRTSRNQLLWYAIDRARQEGRITMRTCYCSVFDDCWIAETGALPRQDAQACHPDITPPSSNIPRREQGTP